MHSPRHLRVEIAARAARLLAVGEARDFDSARRKAAQACGEQRLRDLPDNLEIHRALAEYLQLFHAADHAARMAHLRRCAVAAMEFFAPFNPRLTGPVLLGTACADAVVELHLASDEVEAVSRHLLERRRPYELGERSVRVSGREQPQRLPLFELDVAGDRIEALVLPAHDGRRLPLSALDGRPVKRAGIETVRALLESGQTFSAAHSYA
jgi:hypothetical protein